MLKIEAFSALHIPRCYDAIGLLFTLIQWRHDNAFNMKGTEASILSIDVQTQSLVLQVAG